MFAQASGREGLDGRSFPFDLERGMVNGLLRHPGVLLIRVVSLRRTRWLRSDRLPE